MSEFKICNKCCEYTNSFTGTLGECIKCMSYEPRERKRNIKIEKKVLKEKFNAHHQRVKEDRAKRRSLRRKDRFIL